jgi:hypothetical protein
MEGQRLIDVRIDTVLLPNGTIIDAGLGGPEGSGNTATTVFAVSAYLISGTGPNEKKSERSRLFWFPDNNLPSQKVRSNV